MRLHLHVFEDQYVDCQQVVCATEAVSARLALQRKGINFQVAPITRVVSVTTLDSCVSEAKGLLTDGHILFVDLDLCGESLTVEQAVTAHDDVVPSQLALTRSPDADRRKAGGYLLAWCVLSAGGRCNLLVIASSQEAARPIHRKVAAIRESVPAHLESVPHMITPDSFAQLDDNGREYYIEEAVREWLQRHWCPLARIHPNGSEQWFGFPAPTMPHTFAGAAVSPDYANEVKHYIACAMQLNDAVVHAWYDGLARLQRESLHEYLLCLVGSCAACHNARREGRRLQWRHMPLLAAASAPAPGPSMVIGADILSSGSASILPVLDAAYDGELLHILVGDLGGTTGVLPQLLTDKNDPLLSRFVRCSVVENGCDIVVDYDLESLKCTFEGSVATGTPPVEHDSAEALFRLHTFLGDHGGSVNVLTNGSICIRGT